MQVIQVNISISILASKAKTGEYEHQDVPEGGGGPPQHWQARVQDGTGAWHESHWWLRAQLVRKLFVIAETTSHRSSKVRIETNEKNWSPP